MTEVDDRLVPRVQELINTYGLSVTFDLTTLPTYNPATGTGTPAVGTKTAFITPPYPYADFYVDNDLIQGGDMKAYVAAQDLDFTPRVGMRLTVGTEKWRVVTLKEIRTGASIALYEMQLRR